MAQSRSLVRCSLSLLVTLSACGGTSSSDGDASVLADAASPVDAAMAMRCEPATSVSCVDEQISGLDLFDTVNPTTITEEGTTAGEFLSWIDARGGGMVPSESFVYARFTDSGLEKVEVSDEGAFASGDWDIAFRRFLIRVNSGVGGPSCVQAARTATGTTFDDVATVPSDLSYRTEEYYTDTCEMVPDGSGLNSPATALSSFWTYPGCVSMSGNVYIIALADGRHVKLQVLGYYPLAIQEQCDTEMTLPSPSMSGNVRIRWAFLPASS